ncbi:MAG: hypothetical protein ACO1OB_17350, partial [Archangium sp.]
VSATPISRYDGGQVSSVQVRLTSDRVRRWEFGTASFTRRGYDPTDASDDADVTEFLEWLAKLINDEKGRSSAAKLWAP